MRRSISITAALATGLLVALLAGVIAEVAFSAHGHRIRFDLLPPEAQAIAKESGSNPISPQQWKRMDEVMAKNGGWPNGGDLLHATVRKGWPIFALLPVLALVLLRWRRFDLKRPHVVALIAPCAAVIAWALAAQPGALLAG